MVAEKLSIPEVLLIALKLLQVLINEDSTASRLFQLWLICNMDYIGGTEEGVVTDQYFKNDDTVKWWRSPNNFTLNIFGFYFLNLFLLLFFFY